jgi:hypothetical protein
MPRLAYLILGLVFLFLPAAHAQSDEFSISAHIEDIERTVADTAHYVELVADAVRELDYADRLSGYAISRRVATQVRDRLTTAIELMATIIEDPNLTEDQKAEFTFDLASSIGEVVLTLVHTYGDRTVPPSGDYTALQRAASVLREIMVDLRNLGPRASAHYGRHDEWENWWQRIWSNISEAPLGFRERVMRDREARAAFVKLEEFGREALPELGEDSPLRKAHRDYWTEKIVEKAVNIRSARFADKRWASYVYYGLAAYVLLAPPVDILGLIQGRSDNSLFMSSVMYTSFWIMIATSKIRSVADKTVQVAKNLAEVLNTPVSELLRVEQGSLVTRLKSIGRAPHVQRTCSEILEGSEDT